MNPDQERTQLRSQAETIMAEVSAFGVTAADPLNAVRLLIARIDELESRSIRAASATNRESTEDGRADAERIAQAFHEAYEGLAPSFGYETREASAKPWAEVPQQNRDLMTAVVGALLDQCIILQPVGGDRLSDAERVAKAFYVEGSRLEVEANPELLEDDHADERPATWDETDDDDRGFIIQVFINLLATGQITAGLPTTDSTPVYDVTVAPHLIEHDTAPTVAAIVRERDALVCERDALVRQRDAQRRYQSPLIHRLEQLRSAVIAARALIGVLAADQPLVAGLTKTELEGRWVERFGKLADPPLEVTVEDDDDPADTPTEGEHWVKESSEPGARETTGSGGPVAHPAGWPMTD